MLRISRFPFLRTPFQTSLVPVEGSKKRVTLMCPIRIKKVVP